MAKQEDLSVREALNLILNTISILPFEELDLLDGLGRMLAQPVIAHDSLPPFANSSMDGYAVRAEDVDGASDDNPIRLKVVGDIAAGAGSLPDVAAGTAARSMTARPCRREPMRLCLSRTLTSRGAAWNVLCPISW